MNLVKIVEVIQSCNLAERGKSTFVEAIELLNDANKNTPEYLSIEPIFEEYLASNKELRNEIFGNLEPNFRLLSHAKIDEDVIYLHELFLRFLNHYCNYAEDKSTNYSDSTERRKYYLREKARIIIIFEMLSKAKSLLYLLKKYEMVETQEQLFERIKVLRQNLGTEHKYDELSKTESLLYLLDKVDWLTPDPNFKNIEFEMEQHTRVKEKFENVFEFFLEEIIESAKNKMVTHERRYKKLHGVIPSHGPYSRYFPYEDAVVGNYKYHGLYSDDGGPTSVAVLKFLLTEND